MVLLTLGLWLLVIPLYPARCVHCGLTRGSAVRRNIASSFRFGETRSKLFIAGTFAFVLLLMFIAHTFLEQSPRGVTNNAAPPSNTIPVVRPSPTAAAPDTQREPPFQKAEVYAGIEQLMIDRQKGGAAAEKYLGKVVEVQGVVDAVSSTEDSPSISFRATGLCAIPGGNSVNCLRMAERERDAVAKLHPGDTVTVLGRFGNSGRYELPKEYDFPGCRYYINLDNCTVKESPQTPTLPEPAVPVNQSAPSNVASVREAARQGNANAQYRLGVLYRNGNGVPQNDPQAASWWRKAAEQGYAPAQRDLGASYHDGRGVPQDYSQAVYWLRKAAQQGNAGAQDNLGFMFDKGQGVPQDDAQAVYWYRKAAEQRYAIAQSNLGVMFYKGRGVPQDFAQAYFWLALAASGKVEGVKQEELSKWRDDAASRLAPGELSQVQERVRKWLADHPAKAQ
jgi:hypothetical protein